ncbi:Cytochrome c oxidase copper chaperone,Cysteine alpha-hairpin motif superfamily [Cinara cedri]|uniref:Cytochrome c oxidase copper chaperone n=1 Tax=Cinara cedri TaxID=506608 RepID=A0A5E4M9F2_9HEMI|nr:Cytochrome c oxidase copper chaperone,Cysteine alpha-hairpin motif superfamily [Cinara cedri]
MMPLKTDQSIVMPTETKSAEQPKKLKPCCACPETKKPRDACIMENGEENCQHLIEAHKECMRKMGFNI